MGCFIATLQCRNMACEIFDNVVNSSASQNSCLLAQVIVALFMSCSVGIHTSLADLTSCIVCHPPCIMGSFTATMHIFHRNFMDETHRLDLKTIKDTELFARNRAFYVASK